MNTQSYLFKAKTIFKSPWWSFLLSNMVDPSGNELLAVPYYTDIKRCINQREFESFNFHLSRANKLSMKICLAFIYTHMEKLS